MNSLEIKNLFRSSNCNSSYKILKWINNTNYVIYGSGNLVNIVDNENKKIIYSLKEFEGNIKQIEINVLEDIIYIFIITLNGELGILMINNLYNYNIFKKENLLFKLHKISKLSLVSISTLLIKDEIMISISDSNGNLIINKYSSAEDKLNKLDFYIFGNNLINDLKFGKIKENYYLFISLSDFKLHIYELNIKNEIINENLYLNYLYSGFGHNNKIISIDIFNNNDSELEIITGSSDNSIRIWKIQDKSENLEKIKNFTNLKDGNIFYLYSILNGHLDSLTYCKIFEINNYKFIISSSLDFTIQIWEKEINSDLYISNTKLGEFAGNKNSFLGFDLVKNSNNKFNLIGYTVFGSFFNWNLSENINSENLEKFNWVYSSYLSGHFSRVTDINWSSCGNFLVSTSKDQTTRIWANIENENSLYKGFYEISRPQIHGYDINSICVYPLKNKTDDRKFCDLIISGADEKILRILEPNAYFINNINNFKNKNIHLYYDDYEKEKEIIESENPLQYKINSHVGGNVLGLLIKAVESDKKNYYFDEGKKLIKNEIGKIDFNKNENPTEDFLNQLSLWPENNKLFGHGNQISIVRSSFDGKFLASSSLSKNNKVFGYILIWDPINLKVIQSIESHVYTVLDMCFSVNSEYLISVSKDRQLSLFKFVENKFIEIHKSFPHKRIINGVIISEDNNKIYTCSRDKTIKSFNLKEDKLSEENELNLKENLTSICFLNKLENDYYILVGTENGNIYLIKDSEKLEIIDKKKLHGRTINQIKLNYYKKLKEKLIEIGVCSDDYSLTIINI